jgi:hypothetical protein
MVLMSEHAPISILPGYVPGACNIGPAEIARRRRAAIAATVLTVVVAAAVVVARLPDAAAVVLFPLATGAAVSWLQVVRRFCVAFGAAGIKNLGDLGTVSPVSDPAARTADRATTRRMIIESCAYGAIATLVYWILLVGLRPG